MHEQIDPFDDLHGVLLPDLSGEFTFEGATHRSSETDTATGLRRRGATRRRASSVTATSVRSTSLRRLRHQTTRKQPAIYMA